MVWIGWSFFFGLAAYLNIPNSRAIISTGYSTPCHLSCHVPTSWIDKSFQYAHRWLFYTRLDSILPLYSASLEMAALLPYPSAVLRRRELIMRRHKQWMAEHFIKISRDVRRRWCQDSRWTGSRRSVTAQVAELRTTANATGSSKHQAPRTTISPFPLLSHNNLRISLLNHCAQYEARQVCLSFRLRSSMRNSDRVAT
jgi:hypothetical protein